MNLRDDLSGGYLTAVLLCSLPALAFVTKEF